MKWRVLIRYFTIIEIVVLIAIASYAWFAERNNPSISENNIQVTAAAGLYIKLLPDSVGRSSISLNQIISHFDEFELKQVSSPDAVDFYYVDFGQGLSQGDPRFIKIVPDAYGKIDYTLYGYIDYDFYLQTEDYGKHIYLHKDSHFTGTASTAMRIAITVSDGANDTIYIFGDEKENGIIDPFTTDAVNAEGYFTFNNINPALTTNQVVATFDTKDGGRSASDSDPLDINKLLYSLEPNSQIKVNVKVWLEGGDVDCDNTIASSLMDVQIKFGSANILLDAPTVTANNSTHTITGLTTAMEYSTTNDQNSVWTAVTDANMTFGTGITRYVRIAAIPDTSPESYATEVIFQ